MCLFDVWSIIEKWIDLKPKYWKKVNFLFFSDYFYDWWVYNFYLWHDDFQIGPYSIRIHFSLYFFLKNEDIRVYKLLLVELHIKFFYVIPHSLSCLFTSTIVPRVHHPLTPLPKVNILLNTSSVSVALDICYSCSLFLHVPYMSEIILCPSHSDWLYLFFFNPDPSTWLKKSWFHCFIQA